MSSTSPLQHAFLVKFVFDTLLKMWSLHPLSRNLGWLVTKQAVVSETSHGRWYKFCPVLLDHSLLVHRHTYGKAHEGVPDDSPNWGPSWQPASDMWVNEALAGESPVILSLLHSLQVFLAEKNYCALSESLTHKICDH